MFFCFFDANSFFQKKTILKSNRELETNLNQTLFDIYKKVP